MTHTEQLVIVRRNQFATFAMLAQAFAAEPNVRLVWDRRTGDRRRNGAESAGGERRQSDRRGDPAATWRGNDYLLLTLRDRAAAPSPLETAGAGPEHQQLVRDLEPDLEAAAGSDLSVLLSGGDAISRKFLAQWIHRRSDRGAHPLVVVDSAVFAELVAAPNGHNDGGAPGLTGGTLFIEEIGEWTLPQQSDLVRFVERIAPVAMADRKPARLISATDSWLHDRVAAREFRLDLFYRLNAIHLVLPAARRAAS